MANVELMTVFDTEFLHQALHKICDEAGPIVIHVGSVDSWPADLIKGSYGAMIFNTHYQNQAGEHWVAVYIDGSTHTAYTFDSLPTRPFPHNVLVRLGEICVRVHNTNPQRFMLQHPAFPLCGVYCLAFLERATKGLPLELCSQNQLLNDVTVLENMLPYLL